jgi:hypothetical protein
VIPSRYSRLLKVTLVKIKAWKQEILSGSRRLTAVRELRTNRVVEHDLPTPALASTNTNASASAERATRCKCSVELALPRNKRSAGKP